MNRLNNYEVNIKKNLLKKLSKKWSNWFLEKILYYLPSNRPQLIKLLRNAESHNLITPEALNMTEGIMQISELQAQDIMMPRAQMEVIHLSDSIETIRKRAQESGYSRFPVVDEEQFIGILLIRDLLQADLNHQKILLSELLRTVIFTPESKRLITLLKELREAHCHMALVVDEYGHVTGLITLEDILEQIVGEISDEYDLEQELFFKKIDDITYIFKATIPLELFNKTFSTHFLGTEVETLGGFITQQLGHLPSPQENLVIKNMKFTILRADKRRILIIKLDLLSPKSR